MKKILVAVLLVWSVWMTVRSVVLQRRLNTLEAVVVQSAKEQNVRIAAALVMASDAVHTASGKQITPPMRPRRKK